MGELKPELDLLKAHKTNLVLLLRDILDTSQVTIKEWKRQGYYQAIQHYYDLILVVGMPLYRFDLFHAFLSTKLVL